MQETIDAACAAATFVLPLHNSSRHSAKEIESFGYATRHRQPWIRVEIPKEERSALVEAVSIQLGRFAHPETGEMGFSPAETQTASVSVVGSRTIESFAEDMVRASAILGSSSKVVSTVLAWSECREPLELVQMAILRGVAVPEPLELRPGIGFDTLPPISFIDRIENHGMRTMIDRTTPQPVMLITNHVSPVFYVPSSLKEQAKFANPSFQMTGPWRSAREPECILDALSLACNSAVYRVQLWNDPGEIARLLLGGQYGDGGPVTFNAPLFDSHPFPSDRQKNLTQDVLDRAKAILDQRLGRDDLDVAIARWKNSMTAIDFSNRLIDLRTVMEALYAPPGAQGELKFRCCLRGALHLGENEAMRKEHFKQFRTLYGAASTLVHSGTLPKALRKNHQELNHLSSWSHEACRKAILKRLPEGRMTEEDWNNLALGVPPHSR